MATRAQHISVLAMVAVLFPLVAHAAAPAWFTDCTTRRVDGSLSTCCMGTGPDKSTAERIALDQCAGIATQYVKGYSFKNNSLTVEDTERISLHAEISSTLRVQNLPCNPVRQQAATDENDQYTVYTQCSFALDTASVSTSREGVNESEEESLIKGKSQLESVPTTEVPAKQSYIHSSSRQIILATYPPASSILIRGEKPRMVKVTGNPQTILVYPSDKEIILKAKGMRPKHIQLSPGKSTDSDEVLHVHFDR